MRRLSFDPYEFDPPDSEQFLDLVISSPRQHPDFEAFLAECGATYRTGTEPALGWPRWSGVCDNLRRLAGVDLPRREQCRRVVLLNDEWDDLELAIAAGAIVLWYHWYTTA